jgi:hypothetical protein
MRYVHINNLLKPNGEADYKGIPLENVVPGSQLYDDNEAVLAVEVEELPVNPDITELGQQEYVEWVNSHKPVPPPDLHQIVKDLQAQNAQMMLALVMNDLI